jgi:hypothetical protein
MRAISTFLQEFYSHYESAWTGTGALIMSIALWATGHKDLTWGGFAFASFLCFIWASFQVWHKKHKAVERLEAERELPRLYLYYDPNFGGQGIFNYTGLFLRTEDERIASSIRISSPETVGSMHSRLRIRWTKPGQNVAKTPFPVQLRCVTVKDERESCFNQIDGDQLRHYFREKKDEPMELIVTLKYTDIDGNECPPKRFKIYKEPKTLALMPDRIICEPIKD